jgi:hypothetical protein
MAWRGAGTFQPSPWRWSVERRTLPHAGRGELCELCASQARDDSRLCVVESPADVLAVENSGAYRAVISC